MSIRTLVLWELFGLYIILLMPSVHAIFPVDGIKIMCKNGSRHCGVLAGAAPASRSAGATVLLTPKDERRTENGAGIICCLTQSLV